MNAVMARRGGEPETGGWAVRTASAVVLAPPVLAAVYLGPPFFEIMLGVVALVLAWEWNRLCAGRFFWLAFGLAYIGAPCWALLYLRSDPALGLETVFWLLAVVWSADTGAFLFGRLIGGPKLAPRISPNKTWSGFIGGIGSAGLVGAAAALVLQKDGALILAGWSVTIGAISQAGDLAESWVKRHFRVKDTSTIIPGHGGLFDRVDGLLVAAVAVVLIEAIGRGPILTWT